MNTREILVAARALIEKPEAHCQSGDFAAAADGRSVPWDSPYACRWCAIGALRCVAGQGPAFTDAFDRLVLASGYAAAIDLYEPEETRRLTITMANDRLSHAEVLGWFDRAIATARGGDES